MLFRSVGHPPVALGFVMDFLPRIEPTKNLGRRLKHGRQVLAEQRPPIHDAVPVRVSAMSFRRAFRTTEAIPANRAPSSVL